jgi:hypothetical protein
MASELDASTDLPVVEAFLCWECRNSNHIADTVPNSAVIWATSDALSPYMLGYKRRHQPKLSQMFGGGFRPQWMGCRPPTSIWAVVVTIDGNLFKL